MQLILTAVLTALAAGAIAGGLGFYLNHVVAAKERLEFVARSSGTQRAARHTHPPLKYAEADRAVLYQARFQLFHQPVDLGDV